MEECLLDQYESWCHTHERNPRLCMEALRAKLVEAEQGRAQMKTLIAEYADKLSVAVIVLRRYRDEGGTPLENSIITGQLMETEQKLAAEAKALG